jgi:hypothetical protein
MTAPNKMNNVSVVLATSKTDGASLAHAGKVASPVIAKTRPNVIRLRNGAFIVLPYYGFVKPYPVRMENSFMLPSVQLRSVWTSREYANQGSSGLPESSLFTSLLF